MKPNKAPCRVLRGSIAALLAIAFSTALTQVAEAAVTWDANGLGASQTDGAGAWKNANLWWTGSANQTWVSGDDAIFGVGGTGGAVTLAGMTTVNSLTLNSFSGTYTLGSAGAANTITLNAGIAINGGAGAVTISSPIALNGTQSWTNNGASTFTVSGAVTGGGDTLALDGTGAGLTTLTGGLSFTGGGGLVIGKSGTLGTTISGGTINLGGSGGITISDVASAFTLGAATIFADQAWTNQSSTAMTVTGALALGTSRLTLAGGDFSFGGASSGSVGIDLNGGSRLIAKVAGAFGTSATTLTFNGGNLELRATATTFTGKLDMTAAGTTITIDPASSGNGVTHTISGAAILGGGQTMAISPGSLTTNNTSYGLTLSGAKALTGDSTYTINGNGSGNGTLTFSSGAIDLQSGTRTLTFNAGAGAGVRSAAISGSFVAGSGILDLAGDAPVTIGSLTTSANALQVSGTGTYTFSGTSTFTGGVILNSAGATVIATTAGGLGSTSGKVKFNVDGTALTLRGSTVSYTSGLDTTSFGGTIKVEPATQVAGVVHTLTLANTFGSTTLNIRPGSLANAHTTYGLTLSGTSTLSGDAIFDVGNNGSGLGTLTLGALSQLGGPFTVTKEGAGAMTLGTVANVLFTGSAINVPNGVLISNVSGALSSVPTTTNSTTVTISSTGELRGTVAGSFKSSGTGTPSQAINLSGGTVRLLRSSAADFGGNLTYESGSLLLDRTTIGTTLTQTMSSLSIGTVTLTPTQMSYSAAPTLAFGSTTITGDPTLDTTNVILTLGTLSIGGNTLTTQGTNPITATATSLSGDPIFDNTNGLTLGALGDGGGARTITKRGSGR